MTTTLKVGQIEITSDTTKDNTDFANLVDQLSQRLAALMPFATQLVSGQAAAAITAATTAAATPATAVVGTVTQV